MVVITFGQLPSLLVEWFPSAAETVRTLIEERPGEGAVLTFGIVSECFWWGIFEPALRADDVVAIERCLQVTERLLDEGDQVIQDALSARVLDYLIDPSWQEVVRQYSGPKLRRLLFDSNPS
ncbi:DUF7674 family protein [Kribbella flavida]|uniref:DUF7674 family protein n=1 Tax=Kribbella flavida TaxID=182640 RepID=UPI0011D2BD20|nr:hypothetical protein [Kribbella flavida]